MSTVFYTPAAVQFISKVIHNQYMLTIEVWNRQINAFKWLNITQATASTQLVKYSKQKPPITLYRYTYI